MIATTEGQKASGTARTTAANIGVIGLGRMGQVYANHVAKQVENANLVAIADPRVEVRDEFKARLGTIVAYDDYHDLLNEADLQGVIIATPTSTHREIVIAAAQAGKAIFCEKPTSLSLATTDEMIAAVDSAGVIFQVGFMRRFDEGYVEARRKIDEGVIGRPVTIRSIGRDPFRTSLEFANPAVSGGLIVDMAIHDFDVLRWLMGDEVERVYTESAALVYPELQTIGDADNVQVVLRFKNGALGNVEVSRTAVYGYDIQCEVVGEKGTVQIGYLRQTPILTLTKEGVLHDVVPHFPQRFGKAYTKQIEHFVECIVNDKTPMVSGADGRAALQIALAATISQREGRVVQVQSIHA
ncbi:MAG TPA: inositol 2-dehydrogenase [Aggregatilineales bacterium]|nr:inositol 2-dehydrogenase [Aggregatilineales bacterium]